MSQSPMTNPTQPSVPTQSTMSTHMNVNPSHKPVATMPRYHSVDKDGRQHPIRILFTDNNNMILRALRQEQSRHQRSGKGWLDACYQIDYYQGDIVPLALGNNPSMNDYQGMLTSAAFVSPANSMGHMGGGIDYPLNHKMFPNVSANVQAANRQLAELFYGVQDRNARDKRGNLISISAGPAEEASSADDTRKSCETCVDEKEYQETPAHMAPWYGPLFNDVGQAYMPVGSASISPCQHRSESPNGRHQYLVSAPTMYNPGSSIAGTGNAGAAVFATLACVHKYNRLLAHVGVPLITTIVLPGMGTGVGGMSPSEYAQEAFAAMEDYARYYLGFQDAAAGDAGIIPDHLVDLVPHKNRFVLHDPGYFLRKQRPGYAIQGFDMCYQLMPRPDPEVERLKSLRPTGGLFGSGMGDSGGMFDHKFGMGGFADSGGLGDVHMGGNFKADAEFQAELQQRLQEEEEDELRKAEQGSDEEDDLGAEARMLERMSAMASRRDKIEEEIKRRNEEMMATQSDEISKFLKTQDPTMVTDPVQQLSFEARVASHLATRDEDEEALIKPMTNAAGSVLSAEDMQAQFHAMMSARNNEIWGGSSTNTVGPTTTTTTSMNMTTDRVKAVDSVPATHEVVEDPMTEMSPEDRERKFQEMMNARNKEFSDPKSLTSMWH